jgi:hypothetical protein
MHRAKTALCMHHSPEEATDNLRRGPIDPRDYLKVLAETLRRRHRHRVYD